MNIKIFCCCSLFLPGRAKDLPAPLYVTHLCYCQNRTYATSFQIWYSNRPGVMWHWPPIPIDHWGCVWVELYLYSSLCAFTACYLVNFTSSSSSIGTTTLSWVSACSTIVEHSQQEGFTECRCQWHVKPPTWRRTSDLERSNFHHKRPPASEATLANPAAEGGTMGKKWPRILLKVTTSTLLGSFTCRKAWHGTDGFTSPPKEGVLGIFSPEKSDGFGRVWTCELGYQRPARYLYTTEATHGCFITKSICNTVCDSKATFPKVTTKFNTML
jgi:hypothetical protein